MITQELITGEWDVSRDEYHADRTCLCSTALRDFRQSVPLYRQKHVLGTIPSEVSDEMNLGTALHVLALEPDRFVDEITIAPDVDRRTKAGKEAWTAFGDSAAGMVILTSEQNARCVAMNDALWSNRHARTAIESPGIVERAIRWQEPLTSLWVRNLIDKWMPSKNIVVDIKTSRDPSPVAFAKSIVNYGYHCQAALYLRGVKEVYGADAEFLFIVVGSQPPHEVACYCLDNDAIALGNSLNESAFHEISQRIATDDWSSRHANKIETISLPRWAYQ